MFTTKKTIIQGLGLVSMMMAFALASCDGGSEYSQSSNPSDHTPSSDYNGNSSGYSGSTNNIYWDGNSLNYGNPAPSQNMDLEEMLRLMERSNNSRPASTIRQSGSFTPDDAYDEGYDNGYEQGRYDGRNGRSHGSGYDESNSYYNHYETMYEDGYSEGYDDGYSDGSADYEEDNEDED